MLRNLVLLFIVQVLGIFAAASPGGVASPAGSMALQDSMKTVLSSSGSMTPEPRRNAGSGRNLLQFGGAFGGALLTSGSFTMMAASGGF